MTIRPPDEADLAAVAERYGLGLSAADITSFAPFATGLLGLVDGRRGAVRPHGAGAAGRPPVVPPGRRRQPARRLVRDDGDPRDRRRPARPAARVAIKDNIMVAGVPMMNGSETARGLRPDA